MKRFCGIVVIFVVVLTVTAEDSPEVYKNFAKTCQTETKAADKDIVDMFNGVSPTTKPAKCLYACFYFKIGLVDKNNKLVLETLVEAFSDGITDLVKKCNLVSVPDKCESIAKILDCLKVEVNKRIASA